MSNFAVLGKLRNRGSQLWRQARSPVSPAPQPCMNCGGTEAVKVGTPLQPDFDVRKLPPDLRPAFVDGWDGICTRCGLYQQFNRYTPGQLQAYVNVMTSKDEAVSEQAYHTYPVPADFVARYDERYFGHRLPRWQEYFDRERPRVERALFLRPMFGAAVEYVQQTFGAEVAGLDISAISNRTVCDRIPEFKLLDGQIHGRFEGPFLDSGPYDAVFICHTLIHCIDVHDSLAKIRGLLRPDGLAVISHEINRKPWNPFHTIYVSEWQLVDLLGRHFNRVDRIDDCEADPADTITRFTEKDDSPDFVALVR